MKKSWLLFSLLFVFISAQAQFHTLVSRRSLYKVHEVTEGSKAKSPSDKGETPKSVSHTKMARKQSDDTCDYWVSRYISVSYPLKEIVVASPYSLPKDPFTGKRVYYKDLDLQAKNEDVYAMMPGEVVKVASDKHSDRYIVLQHGDYTVSYCHLSKVWVHKDARIMLGEIVPTSGNTGRSTGHRLHITAKYGKEYIDPSMLFQFVKEIQEGTLKGVLGIGFPQCVTSRYLSGTARNRIHSS